MSRPAKNTTLALAALALVAVVSTDTFACGGGGRSSSRLSIAYSRSAPHMRSQAPRSNYGYRAPRYSRSAPVYQAPPAFEQPISQQPVVQPQGIPQPMIGQPAPQQVVVEQPPVAGAPAPAGPTGPEAASAEEAALAALAAFGE